MISHLLITECLAFIENSSGLLSEWMSCRVSDPLGVCTLTFTNIVFGLSSASKYYKKCYCIFHLLLKVTRPSGDTFYNRESGYHHVFNKICRFKAHAMFTKASI